MRRMIACLLALLLTMSLAVCVAAEEAAAGYVNPDDVYSATEVVGEADGNTPDSVVLTTDAEEVVMADDPAPIEEYGDGDVVKADGETIEEYAEDEIVKADSEPIEEYGFFAWLKNLWKSILDFFGL